jgi:autotransporter-associated beta strand protein
LTSSSVVALLAVSAPALAQSAGGTGGSGNSGISGGAGGILSQAGSAGTASGGGGQGAGGGGGGGAGAAGGSGGNDFNNAGGGAGGSAGSFPGGAGGNGGAATTGGAGGGGGGGGGFGDTTVGSGVISGFSLTGGTGGIGGLGSGIGGGGGGGAGGSGDVTQGGGAVLTINGSIGATTIQGGNGGAGGPSAVGNGGGGGDGGAGLSLQSNGLVLTLGGGPNLTTVTGGNGGQGASGVAINGNGGAGIEAIGTGISITLNANATVTGGNSVGGGPQANAITFAGGANTLTLNGGTLSGNIGDNGGGSITFNQSAAATLGNVITGNGSVTNNGSGTLTLSGANTYSGGTTLSAGTLQLGVDSVFNTVGQPSSGIVSSAIGTGTLTFNGGVLQSMGLFSERTIANSVQITANGGTIDSGGGFFRITSNITDAPGSPGGKLTLESVNGAGGEREIVLSGNNTYSGISYVDSGIVIANSTTALSPNSAFQVNTGGTVTLSSFDNTIASLADGLTGGGAVQNGAANGTATLTITGAKGGINSFSGELRDGDGGEGGLGGPVLNVVKNGTSTQILAGANHYTGTTVINGGVLEIDGSIAPSSMTTANAGGTLTGVGTVGNATIASGGIFAPGSVTPGTSMTVQGSLALQSGAMYLVMLNPATASFANVTGAATLGGATVNAIYANGSYISKRYTILTAGTVNGTFGSLVNTNLPANFTSSLNYDSTHAYLDLALGFGPPSGSGPNFGGGLNINQQNVANALTQFFNTSGGIPTVFGTLTPAGLTQASGELATASQQTTFDAMSQFMGVMTDPFVAGRGDGLNTGGGATGYADEANAYAGKHTPSDALAAIYTKAPAPVQTFEARWSTWIAGYGGSQTTDGNAALGSNNTTSSVYATAVGADYRFSPDTIAGFALAGGGTNFNVVGSGYGRSDLFQAGAFIRHTVGAAYISGALAYGWQDITTDRFVTAAGADHLRAEFNANAFSGRIEGGYRFVSPWIGGLGITPYAAGQFTTIDLPAYAESALSGANTFALAYGAKDVTDTRSELGFRTDKSFAMADGLLTLRSRFAWAYDYDPNRSIAATFQSLPGASFVVNGAAQASDSALTTAAIEMKWRNGWSTAATFEGEFSSVTNSYAGKGVVRYTW